MGQRIATPAQLRQTIGRGLPPLTWISGDELLLVIEAADLLRAAARKQGFEEREVIEIDAHFDRSRLMEASRSQSLFASRKLIDLRLNTKPNKDLGDALKETAATLDDDTRVVLTSPRLEKATTSAAWFTALAAGMLWMETPRIDAANLPRWIDERLGAQQQKASPAVLALIAERTEGNLLATHQAIQRLGLLLPAGELPLDAVTDIVLDSARFELFGLVDAALSGDTARTLRMAHSLAAEDAALPLLCWALADAIRKLLRIRQLMGRGTPMPVALKQSGVFGKREAIMRQALNRLDNITLQHLLRQVALLDRMAKGMAGSSSVSNPWFHAETLLIALSGGKLPGPVELFASLVDA
ncbi:MAG: DNA polymerase III subunit delta [Lautropia sp.]|nr:DNA polymerase III subunit delta [Lautropia sp.]